MLEHLNSNMRLYINELENYIPMKKVKFTKSNSVFYNYWDVLKLDCNLTGSHLCTETIKELLHMLNSSYVNRFGELIIELDSIYNPRTEGQSEVFLFVKANRRVKGYQTRIRTFGDDGGGTTYRFHTIMEAMLFYHYYKI